MRSRLLQLVRSEIRPLEAYPPAARTYLAKLDANESPWPLPPDTRRRIAERLCELPLHRYPDSNAQALREAIARRIDAAPDELVLGCGSDEVIAMLFAALSRPRRRRSRAAVLYPVPAFAMYRISALAHGTVPVEVPLGSGWRLDVDAMCRAIRDNRPNLIMLASPNNPTGNRFEDAAIEALLHEAPDALVIVDEAYAPYSGRSLTSWCGAWPNLAVLGTLSKVGFAGLRVGWARLPRELAHQVDKIRQPFNLGTFQQIVATMALDELWSLVSANVAAVKLERERLFSAMGRMPFLHVYPSDANFLLARVRGSAHQLADRLLAQGISVRRFPERDARLANHLRVTVGTPEENARLLEVLQPSLPRAANA